MWKSHKWIAELDFVPTSTTDCVSTAVSYMFVMVVEAGSVVLRSKTQESTTSRTTPSGPTDFMHGVHLWCRLHADPYLLTLQYSDRWALLAQTLKKARVEQIWRRGLKLCAAELSFGRQSPALWIVKGMHGELCIHLVMPAGGTDYYRTRLLQRLVQREWRWERRFILIPFFPFCFLLFKVTVSMWLISMFPTSICGIMVGFCFFLYVALPKWWQLSGNLLF